MAHGDIIWSILAALAVILTQVATYLKTRKHRREEHAETTERIADVQETVNGTTSDLHGRIDQLAGALTEAGVDVPKARPKR